jgi:uncharacterized protein (TIGR03083 family)
VDGVAAHSKLRFHPNDLLRTIRHVTSPTTSYQGPDVAEAFCEAIDRCAPNRLTACAGWTANDIIVHLVSGADEILRHIPATRSFAEREQPWRGRVDRDVRQAFLPLLNRVTIALETLLAKQPNHVMPWTGREMPSQMFLSHLRNELALHRWDLVGDDVVGRTVLSDPALTQHTVAALAGPLLAQSGRVTPGFVGRVRCEGADDVVLRASSDGVLSMTMEPPEGAATIDAEADVRLLLLWNRFDPGRGGATAVDASDAATVRSMLQGY